MTHIGRLLPSCLARRARRVVLSCFSRRTRRLVAPAAVLCASLVVPSPAAAVTTVIPVTTTADEFNGDGDCSLREAIVAANTNTATDSCPAGSSASTDTIELAAGDTYLLTLPAADPFGPDDPKSGDLDVADDAPALDVFLRTSVTGTQSVIEQTVPGERVIASAGSLRLLDLEIRGGRAPDCGGGVQLQGAGSFDAAHTIFRDNTALLGAGLCLNDAGSAATIADCLFVDNRASTGNGGGIFAKGTLAVTASAFVRNEAATGSAVHGQKNAAGALQLAGSCFVDNSPDAVSNTAATQQSATGCWWGAASGPSGQGPGGGDGVSPGVDFGGFLTAVPASCRPLPLQRNGGFEHFDGDGGAPAGWKLRRIDVATEGRRCDDVGACLLRLDGDGTLKTATQVVRVAGDAGEQITIAARSRAKDVPATAGAYRVRAILVHADGSRESKTLKFATGTHDFEPQTKTITASAAYKKVLIEIAYGKASGTARFDDVRVTIEP
jgi:CSLREA domain-containing protein